MLQEVSSLCWGPQTHHSPALGIQKEQRGWEGIGSAQFHPFFPVQASPKFLGSLCPAQQGAAVLKVLPLHLQGL